MQAPVAMQSAAVPATCGEAMLVPESVLSYMPSRYVEWMQTPGAAIVWFWSAACTAKLLKLAYWSSTPVRQVLAAPPPGWPL